MNEYDVIGTEVIEERLEATNARDAVTRYMTHNPDAKPTQVGSRKIIAFCQSSGKPILNGDKYTIDIAIKDGGEVYTLLEEINTEAENAHVIDFGDDEAEEGGE